MSEDRWRGRERIDLGTQLLDRQVVDPDGIAVGKVDDLELRYRDDGVLEVTAMLVGTDALADRVPQPAKGLLRRLLRLAGGPDEARRIPLDQVMQLTSAVEVTGPAAEAALSPAERRLRDFVAKIPGAGHAGG
ncbi:hypothetical protein GCM10027447_30090 [Glycomyces halotolerans]